MKKNKGLWSGISRPIPYYEIDRSIEDIKNTGINMVHVDDYFSSREIGIAWIEVSKKEEIGGRVVERFNGRRKK